MMWRITQFIMNITKVIRGMKARIVLTLIIFGVLFVYSWNRYDSVTSFSMTVFSNYENPKEVRKVYEDPRKYLSSNLAVTSRLGNHIFELIALLTISRILDRVPTFFIISHLHEKMLKETDAFIPGLLDHFLVINQTLPVSTVPVNFNMFCCIFDEPGRLKNYTDQYLHLKGIHFQSWKYFPDMKKELISYLIAPKSNNTDLPKSNGTNFLTCVHVRRTDFLRTDSFVPGRDYIIDSLTFVEDREQREEAKMITIFFGDDIRYLESLANETLVLKNNKKKDLKTESFISKDTASESILYAKDNCDVVLFTTPHSTFGWWMGYFSKGDRVYYTGIRHTNDSSIVTKILNPDDYFLPHWIPIEFDHRDNIS